MEGTGTLVPDHLRYGHGYEIVAAVLRSNSTLCTVLNLPVVNPAVTLANGDV
jgi:hypothetical protein